MYYHCDNCKLYYREDLIEDCLIEHILQLVEYDFHVQKYFYPLLAEKKDDNKINELNTEIDNLEKKKNRLMKAYMDGIIKEEDFSTEYNLVREKVSNLEQEKINMLDLNRSEFNPQHLMAERDIEREILTEGELSTKDKIINKLQAEKENIKAQLQKFKNFWYAIMNRFHNKIAFDKDEQYKYVSEDLYKAGVFTDDDSEIATNALRKVKQKEEKEKEIRQMDNKKIVKLEEKLYIWK